MLQELIGMIMEAFKVDLGASFIIDWNLIQRNGIMIRKIANINWKLR